MPELSIARTQRTINTYHLDFPALHQRMPVAIDADSKEVFITPWFYPGGPTACMQAASEAGEPLLALDKGYLVRSTFVRAKQTDGRKQKAIDLLVECAERALEEEANAEASDDPEGYVLVGPDKGKILPLDPGLH